jgi:glutamine synthetase
VRKERSDSVRLELRSPDPACNIHLAFATMLAAGLKGIEGRYPLPDPLSPPQAEDQSPPEHLPETLREAVQYADKSEFLRETLGDSVVDRLVACKQAEWFEYHEQVTSFEIDRYLGML